jgi:hypothetical protein
MKFEHFLFQFDRRGEATLNLTFADSISEQELNCIGLVDTNQERGAFCGTGRRSIAPSKERGGRGRFLTLPKRILTELEYETMYQQLNEKFSPLYFAQPAFARMHNSKEPVYALLQRDGSMLDRTPLDDERFIYEVIELDEQGWQDASDKPAAQAFYRAIANSLFRELSLVSGEARNWMLGSWASYKALLGEWDEAKEIVKEKTDEAAARRQLCTLREIIANLPQGSTVNDLKIAYVLRESRGQAKTAGAKCRPAPLVEFIEDELIGRGFLKPNPER